VRLSNHSNKRLSLSLRSPRRTGDRVSIPGDYQYRALHSGPASQRFWHETKLQEAERWLAPSAGDVILDVGCGSGVLSNRLACHQGVSVIGIDGNRAALDFASRTFQRPNLEFRHGLVDNLDFEPECCTKIALLEVIEHIEEAQAITMLRCFRRLLKPKGFIVMTTPNARSLWPLIELMLDRLRLVPKISEDQHAKLYDRRSLELLAGRTGFRITGWRTFNFLAPWIAAVNQPLAERVRRLETLRPLPLGSLLLMVFQKGES
jgi:2-polyprenyl-3-methyl-5-hydroxy-6-metoxy-1,4-benzoquinol methylase